MNSWREKTRKKSDGGQPGQAGRGPTEYSSSHRGLVAGGWVFVGKLPRREEISV